MFSQHPSKNLEFFIPFERPCASRISRADDTRDKGGVRVSTSETVLRLPPKGASLINQLRGRVACHVQSEASVRARSQIAAHPTSWPRVIFARRGERRKKKEEDDGCNSDGDFSRMVEQQRLYFPTEG